MRSKSAQFSPRLNMWFYSIFGVLFFSGIIWLAVHFLNEESESLPWLLKIHGAAAMGSLVVLGVLIPSHMERAWKQNLNRFTAVVMVGLCILMVASGYGLYYCGSDYWRAWISGFHSVAGGALPLVLVWHIFSGRTKRK